MAARWVLCIYVKILCCTRICGFAALRFTSSDTLDRNMCPGSTRLVQLITHSTDLHAKGSAPQGRLTLQSPRPQGRAGACAITGGLLCLLTLAVVALVVPGHVTYLLSAQLSPTVAPQVTSLPGPVSPARQHVAASADPTAAGSSTGAGKTVVKASARPLSYVQPSEISRERRASEPHMALASAAPPQPRAPVEAAKAPLPPVRVEPRGTSPLTQTQHARSSFLAIDTVKTPRSWQKELVKTSSDLSDFDFQSRGKTRAWSGDFMDPGATCVSAVCGMCRGESVPRLYVLVCPLAPQAAAVCGSNNLYKYAEHCQ